MSNILLEKNRKNLTVHRVNEQKAFKHMFNHGIKVTDLKMNYITYNVVNLGNLYNTETPACDL